MFVFSSSCNGQPRAGDVSGPWSGIRKWCFRRMLYDITNSIVQYAYFKCQLEGLSLILLYVNVCNDLDKTERS